MTSEKSGKCPLCGGKAGILYRGNMGARNFFTRENIYRIAEGGGREKLDVYGCLKCGLGFSPHNLSERELCDFYAVQPKDEEYLSQEPGRRKAFRKILNRIEKICRRKGKIFDFGAGPGFFLDEAKRSGWDIYGCETSEWARVFAKERLKIDLLDGNDLDNFPDGFFDVVTLFDVIEHLASPGDLLKLAGGKLKPGGLLVITTPRFESFTRKVLGPRWHFMFPAHLWYFTKISLKVLLDDAGFELVSFQWQVFYFSAYYYLMRFLALWGLQEFLIRKKRLGGLNKVVLPYALGEEWLVFAKK